MLGRKQSTWTQYRRSRNQTNRKIKKAKRKYFIYNLEVSKSNPKKTWHLINKPFMIKYQERQKGFLRDIQTSWEYYGNLKLPSRL